MEFYSIPARLRLVIEPSDIQYIPTGGGKFQTRVIKGTTVEFEPIDAASQGLPWASRNLVARDGVVRGRYKTNDPDLINRLREDTRYGVSYIAVTEDGRDLIDEDYYFIDLPDGRTMFTLTRKIFKSRQGAMGYKQSAEYKEAMDAAVKRQKELLTG